MPDSPGSPTTLSKAKAYAWEVSMKIAVIIGVLAFFGSPGWIYGIYTTVTAIGKNTAAIETVTESLAEMSVTLGGMGQLFGNAMILENGVALTASVNIHSDAGRWSKQGTRLVVTNTGDRSAMTVTLTVEGKFEGEPHQFLNMSRAAGRAVGANPGDQIQVAIEQVQEQNTD